MIVINFFGGPNSGKSTQAAGMFHRFKIDGYNAEHVNEYAKMCVWENRIDDLLIKKYDKKEMVKFYNENFSTEVYLDNLIKIYGHF